VGNATGDTAGKLASAGVLMLKDNKWWNEFPKNPVNTQYLRFLKTPQAKLGTSFEASLEDFSKRTKDINSPIKTQYTDFLELL
jgi:hypothetical protein